MVDKENAQKIAMLESVVEQQRRLIGYLNERVSAIEKKLGMTEILDDAPVFADAPKNLVSEAQVPQNKILMVDEYNALNCKEDLDTRSRFVKKYKVRALTCANADDRLNNASLPPEFMEVASVESGEYWAIPAEKVMPAEKNIYFVLPNVKGYTANLHSVRAMDRVFESNFEAGNVYDKIFVRKPAIFILTGNSWKIINPGRLKLE